MRKLSESSESVSHSVVSDSLRPHGLWPTRLLCPWNSPGKNTGVASRSLSRGSPWPRDQTWVSCSADRFFTGWATLFSKSLSSVKYPSLSDLFLPETMLLNIPGTLSGKYSWNTPFSYVSSLKSHHDPLWGCQLSYLLLDNNLVKKTARRILIHYCFFFFAGTS